MVGAIDVVGSQNNAERARLRAPLPYSLLRVASGASVPGHVPSGSVHLMCLHDFRDSYGLLVISTATVSTAATGFLGYPCTTNAVGALLVPLICVGSLVQRSALVSVNSSQQLWAWTIWRERETLVPARDV